MYIIILFFQYKSKSFIDFIPNFKQNNNAPNNIQIEKKLNDEILKNKKLESEINRLNNIINQINQNESNQIRKLKDEIEKYKNKCDIYKKEIENLKKENIKLNEELSKSNKIIGAIQNNKIVNNELNKLRDDNAVLRYQLNMKDNEINNLKLKNKDIKFNLDDIIVIYFTPTDSSFYQGIKCVKTETFAEVEEKLCKEHNELRNTNNMFTANALPILRFKTIAENNIKDGDVIQLYKLE